MNDWGGKGNNLRQLRDAGFPVPQFGTLPADLMRQHLLVAELTGRPASDWPRRIIETPLGRTAHQAIEAAAPVGERFAVRSSALVEDGACSSFAGQFHTAINVPREDLGSAVRTVWASAYQPAALAYAAQRGIECGSLTMGVVIQSMCEADAAGVAFAIDPVSGNRRVSVVCAIYGLGEGLVSGEFDADTYRVSPAGHVDAQPAFKPHRLESRTAGGTQRVAVPLQLQAAPVLSDEEARAIAGWARQLSVHFGRWQDIEWARRDGCLYLLQSRPITNLAGTPDSDAELTLWDNSNIVESYAGITTPLTFSFVRNVYRQVYQQFCIFMGVEPALIEENSTIFEMLGLMRGRIYYNLLNWYRALSLLPGYAINAEFMEQMMGVAEGFEIPPAPVPATRNRWLRLLRSAAGVLRAWRTLDREIAGFYQLVDAELARLEEHPLDTLTMHAVVARFERIESTLIANWRAPLVNDFFAMICFGALRKVITHWCTDLPVEFQNDLLTAEQSIVSTEPITRLSALAERCCAVPELAGATSPEDLLETIATHEALFAEFEALRERFGARTLEELKLETVTARQNPALLAGQLLAYIRQPIKPTDALANRLTAESAFLSVLRSPLRRRVGMWLLRHTRRRVAERENLRFQRTRVFDAARTLFIQLGRQLALDGALAQERDVFWLTKEEIFGFVRGTAIDTDLDTLVARRRSEWSAFADDAPSDRFETRGATCFANTFQGSASEIDCDAVDELAGLGCCPGVVSAEVVVVTDPRQCADLDGRILVAEHTDPGWTPLFPLARGILVQRGSLLSHSAIVARELGIPAVVSIPGLTQQLKTGDLVTLNGSTGRVIVHRREALQESPP